MRWQVGCLALRGSSPRKRRTRNPKPETHNERMSSLYAAGNAVVVHTGVNLPDKEGSLLKENSGALAVNDSATAAARAVCLEGNAAAKDSSVVPLGCCPAPIRLKAGGTITKWAALQQKNDGTVEVDAGSGARVIVGVALEDAVSGDLFLAIVHSPRLAS
jgi:hypothetical protein